MATNERARANGFATPASTDLIRHGDNAIAQNARAAVDLYDRSLMAIDNFTVEATTLDYGQPATATFTGTMPNKTINIGIPKGMPDDVGALLVADAQTASAAATAAAAEAAAAADRAEKAEATALKPADDVVAATIDNPSTLTRAALDANFVGAGDLVVAAVDFGVTADGVTDDSLAVQAAIDHAESLGLAPGEIGATVLLPPGRIKATGLTLKPGVQLRGAGRYSTSLYADTGDLFTWTDQVREVLISDIWLYTGVNAGHVFHPSDTAGLSMSRFECVTIMTRNPASSLWYQRGNGNTIDVTFEDCNLDRPAASTVPAWDVITTAPTFNSVRWINCRAHGHGSTAAPFWRIECDSTVTWNWTLTWSDITGEQNPGGLIHLYGVNGALMDQIVEWDYSGEYVDDYIKVGKLAATRSSVGVNIRNVVRTEGTLAVGKYDINVSEPGGRGIHIENVRAGAAGGTIFGNDYTSILATPSSVGAQSAQAEYRHPVNITAFNNGPALWVQQRYNQGHGIEITSASTHPDTRALIFRRQGEAYPRMEVDAYGAALSGPGTVAPAPGINISAVAAADLPPASAEWRGHVVIHRNQGATNEDIVKVCRYGGNDGTGYVWTPLH